MIYGPKSVKGLHLYAYGNGRGAIHGFVLDPKTGVPGQLWASPFAGSGRSMGIGTWSRGSTLLVFAASSARVIHTFTIDPETGRAILGPLCPTIGTARGAAGIAVERERLYVANREDARLHG